jgi:hypothetical protein
MGSVLDSVATHLRMDRAEALLRAIDSLSMTADGPMEMAFIISSRILDQWIYASANVTLQGYDFAELCQTFSNAVHDRLTFR